jgi:leucine dehydrogenase
VAVQGVGNVGRRLCEHLREAGATLVVTDVDAAQATAVGDALGARVVEPSAIVGQEVDVFAPCALGSVLDDVTIARLRCKVVAGAANNQLAEERHADLLAHRGILYAPDFIMNAGGVIGASRAAAEDGADGMRDFQKIVALLEVAFDRAERERTTPHAAAVQMAKEALAARRLAAAA